MLRIGICDDELQARLALRSALERALVRRRSQQAQFFEFSTGEGLLRCCGARRAYSSAAAGTRSTGYPKRAYSISSPTAVRSPA